MRSQREDSKIEEPLMKRPEKIIVAALEDQETKKMYVTAVTEKLTSMPEMLSIHLMTNIVQTSSQTMEIGLVHPETRTWMSEKQTKIRHLSQFRQRALREHNRKKTSGRKQAYQRACYEMRARVLRIEEEWWEEKTSEI